MALIKSIEKKDCDLIIEPGRAEKNYWKDLWRYREKIFCFRKMEKTFADNI
jgi:hypothetical protein